MSLLDQLTIHCYEHRTTVSEKTVKVANLFDGLEAKELGCSMLIKAEHGFYSSRQDGLVSIGFSPEIYIPDLSGSPLVFCGWAFIYDFGTEKIYIQGIEKVGLIEGNIAKYSNEEPVKGAVVRAQDFLNEYIPIMGVGKEIRKLIIFNLDLFA